MKVEPRTLVPYDFSCEILALDEQNIMIDPLGIRQEDSDSKVWLCSTCHPSIMLSKRPAESLANFRWVGSAPWKDDDMPFDSEVGLLIACLEPDNSADNVCAGDKQLLDPREALLIHLIHRASVPPRPSSEVTYVIARCGSCRIGWEICPRLRSQFTVFREIVYNSLQWLCRHNEDYRYHRP